MSQFLEKGAEIYPNEQRRRVACWSPCLAATTFQLDARFPPNHLPHCRLQQRGQTTFAKEFLPSIGVLRFLNADEIARGLSPLKPEAVAFKAGRLLLSELRELIDRHETFALESTLSGRTYVSVLERAKQQGYVIELHFIWIPDPREAIRRVRQRVIEGGHDVPAGDIRRRFSQAFNICSMTTRR